MATATLEILEVGSQSQVLVLLFCQFCTEQLGFCARDVSGSYIGFRSIWIGVLEFAVHEGE